MEGYDQSWHEVYADQTLESARRILPLVASLGRIESVLEIGCGHGHWMSAAQAMGVADFLGVDGPWTEKGKLMFPVDRFRAHDLNRELRLERRFDLVMSVEVAEHVETASSAMFVDNMIRHGDLILFGAATPLQGGYRHINEQWPSFWRKIFEDRGYRAFDVVRPVIWNDSGIHYYYRQNILVYANTRNTELIEALKNRQSKIFDTIVPLDLIHPEKFLEMAAYRSIVLKRLLPRLPGAVARTFKRKISEHLRRQ